jgi:hypothetical protein
MQSEHNLISSLLENMRLRGNQQSLGSDLQNHLKDNFDMNEAYQCIVHINDNLNEGNCTPENQNVVSFEIRGRCMLQFDWTETN